MIVTDANDGCSPPPSTGTGGAPCGVAPRVADAVEDTGTLTDASWSGPARACSGSPPRTTTNARRGRDHGTHHRREREQHADRALLRGSGCGSAR
ncbi:hypothetical protein B7486_76200, partial [cyanobacterium TDX16]